MTHQHDAAAAGGDPGRPAPATAFSGAHPFRPQCAITAARAVFAAEGIPATLAEDFALDLAERITVAISAGACPRCGEALLPDPAPDGWKAAGTRALPCRCVPICDTCAGWIEPIRGSLPVTCWPTNEVEMDDGRTLQEDEAEFASRLKANHPATAGNLVIIPGAPALLTETGVIHVEDRPHPGGWLEFGFDDTDDNREAQR
jgi:hypothetical protein